MAEVSDISVHQKAAPPAASRRTAWVMVIIMTALLVLALLGTIWGFVRQARVYMAHQAAAKAPISAPPQTGAAASITLAPGARIVSATTDAGKLVLHVETPVGGEVEIIDLATGKLTGQVRSAP